MKATSFIRPGRAPLIGFNGAPLKGPTVDLPNEVHVIVVRPNGERSLHSIERGRDVYWKAAAFIAKGGRYAATITPDNDVHLVAILWHDGISDWAVLAEEKTTNDGKLPAAVDRLARL